MIEYQGAFVTYALEVLPDSPGLYLAQTLPDHRLDYWDLEGPISGNRGNVQRVTRGVAVIGSMPDSIRQYLLESPELRASLLVLPERSTTSITLNVVRWEWSNGDAQRQDSAY